MSNWIIDEWLTEFVLDLIFILKSKIINYGFKKDKIYQAYH